MSKNNTKLKIVILTIVLLFLFVVPGTSLAYSPNNTHPDLTKEMAELYNFLEKDHTFTQKQVDWMKKGAENEDKPARWINHFYDPVHKIGWDGSNFGNLSKEEGLAQGEGLSPRKLLPSIKWVVNQEAQAMYGNQYGNRTWQRALHSYINGDEKEAFITLGHVLHLVEDLSVPDHTRNDPHSGLFGDSSSPYEDYSKEYSNSNTLLVAEKLFLEKVDLMNFNKVQDAFEHMANYSNSSFFSEDTVSNVNYREPNIFRLDKVVRRTNKEDLIFMYDKGNNTYLSYKDSSGDYSLKEEELILPSYVEHLFPKAVLVGASVIDLFFKEVEKYKENPDLLEPLVADSHESIVATIKKSPKIIVLNTVNFVDDTVVGTKIVIQDTKDKIVKSVSGMASIVTNFFSAPSYVNDIDISNIATVVKAVDSPQESTEVVVIKEPVVVETKPKIEEIEILEEIVIVENKKIEEQNITEVESEIETEEDSTDIYKPKLIPVNTPFFGGGGGGSNNTPDSSTDDIVLDTEAPTVSLTSLECQNTLAVSGCLVATTTLNFSWSSEADDLGYYILDQNGAISTTTATSTALIVSNNTTYNFSVSAKDETGNTSATSTQEIEIMTSPIVINEVAWAGTTADSSDEWVELYNISTKDIDLSQWVFMAEDGVPYIPLSGIVSAGEYYLLERTDDDTVSDIQADLVAPFSGIGNGSGLSNSGEDLLLLYVDQNNATSTIDEVPSCGGWCGGLSSQKYTMERYDPYGSDWATAIGYMWNGSDASINSIIGTPKAKNSISYQIANGTSLSTDKTLTQENSPYLVTNSGFTVNAGITLTLEEGVVIKIVNPNEPQIVINGTLKTTGIASNPVVITAFADDEYGGDMNNDATSTTPTAGSWKNLTINDSSLGSSLDNTIIRYGGRWFNNMSVRASVIVDTADVSFQNVTVEHSKKHGLHLTSSASTVLNSIFKNNNTDADSAGLYVASGSPNISDNTFQDNKYGMFVSSSPDMSASSNNFIDNSIEAVHVSSSIGLFSGNTGSGNGLNAILIGDDGSITDSGSGTTTLGANSLPYLVRGSTQITASTTLAFEDGVVIKSYNNVSSYMGKIIVKDGGKLFHNSTNSDNLIFTSIHDDSVGEAVDSTITSPSAGDWYGIDVESGGMLDMSGFTVRYAGGKTAASGNDKGGIKFTGGTATSTIANALIQDNYQYGIRAFSGVSLSVSNTTIKNHTEEKQPPAAGIILFDSDLELQNMTFDNNDLDVYALGSYSLNCLENCSTANTDPIGLLP